MKAGVDVGAIYIILLSLHALAAQWGWERDICTNNIISRGGWIIDWEVYVYRCLTPSPQVLFHLQTICYLYVCAYNTQINTTIECSYIYVYTDPDLPCQFKRTMGQLVRQKQTEAWKKTDVGIKRKACCRYSLVHTLCWQRVIVFW